MIEGEPGYTAFWLTDIR